MVESHSFFFRIHSYVHTRIIVSPQMYLDIGTMYRDFGIGVGKIWNPYIEDHIHTAFLVLQITQSRAAYMYYCTYNLNIRTKGKSFILIFARSLYVFTIQHESRYDNISCQSSFRKLVINHFSKYNFSNLCCLLAMRNDDICDFASAYDDSELNCWQPLFVADDVPFEPGCSWRGWFCSALFIIPV